MYMYIKDTLSLMVKNVHILFAQVGTNYVR